MRYSISYGHYLDLDLDDTQASWFLALDPQQCEPACCGFATLVPPRDASGLPAPIPAGLAAWLREALDLLNQHPDILVCGSRKHDIGGSHPRSLRRLFTALLALIEPAQETT
jgi:hypothetical protein